jgi:hypothetical protein
VSGNGAFEDEMDLSRRQKPADDELAVFAQAVRVTLLEEPDGTASSAYLIPRLAEAARASAAADRGAMRKRPAAARSGWAPVLRVAIAIALVPLLSVGLAFAGVNLPGPANDAFETVGVELPNQAAPDDEDDSGTGTSTQDEGTGEPGAEGLSNAAEKRGHGKSKSNPAREGGRANGTNGRGRALGKRGLAPGQTKPKRSSDGSDGNGTAVGKYGLTAPGQAKDKPAKRSIGSGGGSGKGGGKRIGTAKDE